VLDLDGKTSTSSPLQISFTRHLHACTHPPTPSNATPAPIIKLCDHAFVACTIPHIVEGHYMAATQNGIRPTMPAQQ